MSAHAFAHTEVSRLVAASIRAGLERNPGERVGPFTVLYDPASTNVWRNYAVPDDGATPDAGDVAALVSWFVAHDRVPRLEYVPAAAPAVEGVLRAGGFVVEGRPPLMACRPGEAVGGGLCAAPVDGVSELAAVGVIESHRRRGIATAVTALLTRSAHARGARLVWLEPAGEREAAVYARVGFRPDGHKLWISLPGG